MKKVITILQLFCLISLQSSCIVMTGPNNNEAFKQTASLSDLEGTYNNLGESSAEQTLIYLSSFIWSKVSDLDHKSIETVSVKIIKGNTLFVKASGNIGVIREDMFVQGIDFKFDSGRVTLRHGVGFSAVPFTGVVYDRRTLGVDNLGHGKFRSSGAVAGVAFLVIPMIGAGRNDIRFVKISD